MKLLRRFLAPLLALCFALTPAPAGAFPPARTAAVLSGVQGWSFQGSSADLNFALNAGSCTIARILKPCGPLIPTTRASTGYVQWLDGHLTLVAVNTPRLSDKGLLVEQAATNLVLQSQTLDNATWTKTACTVGANSATAPDGTLTADSNIPNNGSNGNAIGQASLTVAASSVYTYSADFKYNPALGLPWIELTTTGDATRRGWFNTQTGAIGTVSGYTNATTTALANGFFRFTVTFTAASSTGSETLFASSRPSNGSFGSVTGDGATPAYYQWGVQFELGANASSYIPTTTVAMARAADNVPLAGPALAAALASKAMYAQTNGMYSNLANSNNIIAFFPTGAQALRSGGIGTFTADNAVNSQANGNLPSGTFASRVKSAYGYDSSSYTAIANGGTPGSTASPFGSTGTTAVIGNRNTDFGRPLNGYLERLAFGAVKGQYDRMTVP